MPDGMGMGRVAFTLHNALTHWVWSVFPLAILALLLAIAGWYLSADWALAARGRRWPARRTASFLGGLLAVELAIQSPIAALTGTYFQAHIVQHLLLMTIAPPLLALGAPSTLLLQTASRRTKERWIATLRSKPFLALSNPVTAWFLYFGGMIAFFLTSLINVAMHHMTLMDVANLVFLFGGTLYWWPMIGVDPIMHGRMGHGARLLNILLGSGIEAFLGVAMLSYRHPIASMYTVASTRTGGALLWASTELVTIGVFIPIFLQWARSEDRVAARADRIADRFASAGQPAAAREPFPGAGAGPGALAAGAGDAAGVDAPSELPPVEVPGDLGLSAWELAWLAKTGAVPVPGRLSAGIGLPPGANAPERR